jgi:glycosyltransferase involved in cell wall biosynthesis
LLKQVSIVRDGNSFRSFDINFYEQCDTIDITLIHSNPNLKTSLKNIQLKNKPVLFADPVSLFTKNNTLLSLTTWKYFENLEAHLKYTDVICTLEPYFFVSKQCAKLAEKLHKPLVVTSAQNLVNHPSRFVPPYSLNLIDVRKRASLFIAMTNKCKNYLTASGIPKEKINVVYPGIDVERFYPNKKQQAVIPRVLFVGNLYPSKGLPELLSVSAELNKDGFLHELWICGTGNLLPLVNEYASKSSVNYLGFVEYSEMPEIYYQCDIFCLPSRDYSIMGIKVGEEQFGFVFLEAMSSALPIVTTNSGSISEVVGDKNFLIKKESKIDLYNSLKRLIIDEKLRRDIGESNRVRAANLFDVKKQASEFQTRIQEVSN